MRTFFKFFFASLAASVLLLVILLALGVKLVSAVAEPELPELKSNAVLRIDLSAPILEQGMESGLDFPEGKTPQVNGLFDMVRAIKQAATDDGIKALYLYCNGDGAGYASNAELREALVYFKTKKKTIYAFAENLTQRGYELANVAEKIYVMPMGKMDWLGYGLDLTFFKGTLDKLEVEPQIIYAGKFKSFTEPFRLQSMSSENRLQLTQFVEAVYGSLLNNTATARGLDSSTLRRLANTWGIKSVEDAVSNGLITAARYDDEVKSDIKSQLGLKPGDKINFISVTDYIKLGTWNSNTSANKIALIYAEGDIVDGKTDGGQVGGETYSLLLRKARFDSSIKAVVLRVNSPGGSAVASEAIWREVGLCRKVKPVVVSMGDYAASGGYYISCAADSIFAQPSTLTGSIGVFIMYFNAQKMFNNKLGVSFDGVKTGPYADFGSISRPMTEAEKSHAQVEVDAIYANFLQRVADGRKLRVSAVDSISQGRVWSGKAALAIGLVDKMGGLQDAIDCAARMAKVSDYELREWPFVKSFWEKLSSETDASPTIGGYALQQQIGKQNFALLQQMKAFQAMAGVPQMRLPFALKP
ncbi:MAG: signal peptide peptidase SppA [Bacteroidetes bacterium]|nr:MAG: signal peptide peptidase SppA [Bacteroidota bacterium]